MNAFVIEGDNKPGELARITEAIADRGINISSISLGTCGDRGTVAIISNDESGTRSALGAAGLTFHETEVVPAALADQPGSLAQATRRLADAGVNIEALIPTGMSGDRVTVAFAVDKADAARTALAEFTASRA
ncbi:MAG TPA: ACT domain-containing protein [Candidatus Limnocylindrales bacterium]|jgi:hypothetical protein